MRSARPLSSGASLDAGLAPRAAIALGPSITAAARGLVAALLCLAAASLAGCSGETQCTTELATGSASFKGTAVGKSESEALRRDSIRDACRQKCAADKAPMVDACTATCTTDVASQKLGAKTTCGRK